MRGSDTALHPSWLAWVVPRRGRPTDHSFTFIVGSVMLHAAIAMVVAQQPEAAAATPTMQAEVLIEAPDIEQALPEPQPEPEPEPPPPQPQPLPRESVTNEALPEPSEPPPPQPPAEEPPDVMDNPDADPNADFTYRKPINPGNGAKSVPHKEPPKPIANKGVANGKKDAALKKSRAEALRQWFARVSAVVAQRAGKYYPRRARQLRQEGIAVVSLVIDPFGNIAGVRVKRSSGHTLLDEAAVTGINAIGKVPAPPAAAQWKTAAFNVPIAFRLQ